MLKQGMKAFRHSALMSCGASSPATARRRNSRPSSFRRNNIAVSSGLGSVTASRSTVSAARRPSQHVAMPAASGPSMMSSISSSCHWLADVLSFKLLVLIPFLVHYSAPPVVVDRRHSTWPCCRPVAKPYLVLCRNARTAERTPRAVVVVRDVGKSTARNK